MVDRIQGGGGIPPSFGDSNSDSIKSSIEMLERILLEYANNGDPDGMLKEVMYAYLDSLDKFAASGEATNEQKNLITTLREQFDTYLSADSTDDEKHAAFSAMRTMTFPALYNTFP